jgi:hypothetical protein
MLDPNSHLKVSNRKRRVDRMLALGVNSSGLCACLVGDLDLFFVDVHHDYGCCHSSCAILGVRGGLQADSHL